MGVDESWAAARERVAAASRRLAAEGLVVGTGGNVSARCEDGGHVALTPTGAALAAVEAGGVAIVDLDGRHVDGPLAATSELDLHLAIYRRREEARAVVHTHSPMATALACVLDEVPPIHYQMLALGGSIRVAPYATFSTPQLAEATVGALEGRAAALMANHGAIAFAHDVDAAVEQALLVEWACTLYHRAARHGTPRALSAAQLEEVVQTVVARGYGTTKAAR